MMSFSQNNENKERTVAMNDQKMPESSAEQGIYQKKTAKKITLITAIVVLLTLALNILVTVIGDKQLWYLDLTETKYKSAEDDFYTLSGECADLVERDAIPMVESVNKDRENRGEEALKINIVFCADKDMIEGDARMRYISYTARALAKKFSDQIEVQYLNINKNPSSVQKYKTNSAASIYNSDVIVEFGSEYLVQSVNAFYLTDTDSDEPWAYNGEKRLSAMILAVTRAEAPICALTNNHGESLFDANGEIKAEYSTFIDLIHGAGYDPVVLDLEKEEIPENCRLIITFDPSEDFHAFGNLGENNVSEIEKLDKYLDGSNAFFYVCDKDTAILKNLEEYLEEWGITVARKTDVAGERFNYTLEDTINNTDGKGNILLGNYATAGLGSSLTEDMRKRAYAPKVIFGNSTAIAPAANYIRAYVDADEESGEQGFAYYSYYKNGVSRNMMDVFTSFDTASAYANGELCEVATEYTLFKLMTVTQEQRQIQDGNFSSVNNASYVISLASTDFLHNDVLNSTAYGNTDVILSTLRNTGSEAVPADIDLKAFYEYGMADQVAYSTSNPIIWFRCLLFIPFVAILSIGIVVTVRRRYK